MLPRRFYRSAKASPIAKLDLGYAGNGMTPSTAIGRDKLIRRGQRLEYFTIAYNIALDVRSCLIAHRGISGERPNP
jgi:hypothetical protein